MGGCRCTYKNCNMKSDGKTHMFHYPVFDKVRCHQWLVNAQKLEFLDLKLSQLKNRCICQHHFKEDNFMNYKKDKLTFDAVPTLNGPFCDLSKLAGENKEYPIPILVEDIENDFDVNDKKSNFSVKYGDFLTNNEFVDSSARYNRNISITKDNAEMNLNSSLCIKGKDITVPELQNDQKSTRTFPTRKIKKTHIIKKKTTQPMLVVPPYSDLSNELKMGKELNLEQKIIDSNSNLKIQDKNSVPQIICVTIEQSPCVAPKHHEAAKKRESKVKILSEKKIEQPIDIGHISKFEKISPSRTLTLPAKSFVLDKVEKVPDIASTPSTLIWSDNNCILEKVEKEQEITPNILKVNNKLHEKLKVLDVLDVEFDPLQGKNYQVDIDIKNTSTNKEEKIVPQSLHKKSTQMKNKVTPERSAAIEKKRKFNMRLKDIIENCLDKLDDPVNNLEISPSLIKKIVNPPNSILNEDVKPPDRRKTNQSKDKVVSHLAEEHNLPSVKDTTVAYLEERMRKMENTLLDKIAQNSQQIIDFKNTWTKDLPQVGKKRKEQSTKRFVSTQTHENESCYKKFLYQEISKYLSPSSNSAIYEELFINKYSREEVKIPSKRKRRKCI